MHICFVQNVDSTCRQNTSKMPSFMNWALISWGKYHTRPSLVTVSVFWYQQKQMSPLLLIKPNISCCLATVALHTQEASSSYPGVQRSEMAQRSLRAGLLYLGQKTPCHHAAAVQTIFVWRHISGGADIMIRLTIHVACVLVQRAMSQATDWYILKWRFAVYVPVTAKQIGSLDEARSHIWYYIKQNMLDLFTDWAVNSTVWIVHNGKSTPLHIPLK